MPDKSKATAIRQPEASVRVSCPPSGLQDAADALFRSASKLPPGRLAAAKKTPDVVQFRAAVGRLRRRLAAEGLTLRRARGTRWFSDLGEWYATDCTGFVAASHIDIPTWVWQSGLIRDGETIAAEVAR